MRRKQHRLKMKGNKPPSISQTIEETVEVAVAGEEVLEPSIVLEGKGNQTSKPA